MTPKLKDGEYASNLPYLDHNIRFCCGLRFRLVSLLRRYITDRYSSMTSSLPRWSEYNISDMSIRRSRVGRHSIGIGFIGI